MAMSSEEAFPKGLDERLKAGAGLGAVKTGAGGDLPRSVNAEVQTPGDSAFGGDSWAGGMPQKIELNDKLAAATAQFQDQPWMDPAAAGAAALLQAQATQAAFYNPWMGDMYNPAYQFQMQMAAAAAMHQGNFSQPDWGAIGRQQLYPDLYPMPPAAQAAGQKQGGGSRSTKSRGERRRRGKGNAAAADEKEAPEGSRHPLLEELRKGGKLAISVDDLLLPGGPLLEFARDQFGHKVLLEKLESHEEQQRLFAALLPEVTQISSDMYGSQLVQKLFDICGNPQKKQLTEHLAPAVKSLSVDLHGCRVVQKALESVSVDQQVMLANELKNYVIKCVEDQHGNHVIQKCIERMPPEMAQFVIDAFVEKDRVEKMAMHCFGCRVIQRLVEHCTAAQLGPILDEVLRHIPALSEDHYGNYVIQHVLEHGRTSDKKRIIELIKDNILSYATKKCSSNVVEKCFEIATIGEHAPYLEQERAALISAVLGDGLPPGVDPPLLDMMRDKFGNYIVQRMCEHTKGEDQQRLFRLVGSQEEELRRLPVGLHVLNTYERLGGVVTGPPAGEEGNAATAKTGGGEQEPAMGAS